MGLAGTETMTVIMMMRKKTVLCLETTSMQTAKGTRVQTVAGSTGVHFVQYSAATSEYYIRVHDRSDVHFLLSLPGFLRFELPSPRNASEDD